MLVKKFEAESVEKAIAEVKRQLGVDALILSTETIRKHWWKKPRISVTAAIKTSEPSRQASYDSDQLAQVFPHRRDTRPEERPTAKPDPKPAPSPESKTVRSAPPAAGTPEEEFVSKGFSVDSAREFSRQIVTDFSRSDRRDLTIMSRVKSKLVASNLRTLGPEVFESRKTWAVIGPPGAGKTSLIVKLAHLQLSIGNRVALISGDKRKLLGTRELGAYAKLLGAEFRAGIGDRPTGHLTFIDTPALLWREAQIVAEIEKTCRDSSTLLVLDASHRLEELLDSVNRSQRFAPVAIAFTRLDQVSRIGVVHDVIRAAKLPLLGCSISAALTSSFRFFDSGKLASYIIDFQSQRPAELR